ncbi:unnamed protein product [Schistosoma margrebowiei]|uniref:Uncharacterized protein n=1 Tax=Schistosoma margrebowiei TaxID=48269 RepID=A0A183MNP9_9TREM|nr:unnamed protein product [Schistosoma margrebowiei]
MFENNESIIDRKTCLINNSLNMESINNQLFNNNNNHNYKSSSMRIDKSDKLPCINDCKLSIPKLYKAKITPDWIVTICSEIWKRLLSSSSSSSSFILDSNENNIDHQISGSKLVTYLMINENKTDRNLICGLWQLLLDENAIEPILSLNNNDKTLNSIEFYDRDDVFYICNCIKNKRLSIDEALIINEISLNINQSNLEQNHDLLKLINNTSNDPMTQINLHNNITYEKSNQYIDINNDHNHEIDGYHILIDKLYRLAPEALFRKILQKLPSNRTENELQYVYQELLLVPALSSFSISVKQELCKCLYYEVHENALDIVFYQGDPGISWYIIYHGSVWVHINNQGYICLLNEGDDFGKLSLITDKPRAASILLAENNCHFLKLNKNDFNRILCNVEANTVHLKNNNSDVLILERIPDNKLLIQLQNNQLHNHIHNHQINDNDNQLINKLTDHNYSIIAGTIEYILYHLLENCLNELNNQLQSIINNQLYPSYLYPHTPYNIDQTWQIFFLTYKLFTTNNEILLFLYKYLACNKPFESIHETNNNNNNNNNNNSDNNNNNNNKDIHDYDQHWEFPNNFQFDTTRVCRVTILFYIWRYCLGLFIFANQIEVNQFIMNLKIALSNMNMIETINHPNKINILHDLLDSQQQQQSSSPPPQQQRQQSSSPPQQQQASYPLYLMCLNKLIKKNEKLMNIKPMIVKQHNILSNFLHFPHNFLRTLPFVCNNNTTTTNNNKRGMIKMNKTQLATSSEHGDSSITTTTTSTSTTTTATTTANYVKSLDSQDTTIVHNEQYNSETKSIPNLLFDLHIIPNTLPLIQSIHTVTIKIYITELTKQINITVPIEANVYEIKQLLITNQMIQSNINELKLVEVFSKGDWIIYQDYECGIMFSLSPNSRLFLTKESQIKNLIPLAEQLIVTMNFLELNDIDRIKNLNQHDHLLLRKNKLMQTSIRLLDELTIDELATILSCCHVQLAICIHPQELLDYVIGNNDKGNKPCSHIRTLVKRFSLLHAWTITQIVTTCNLTKRANIIKKLIKLANCLISSPLYDLYSSFAIILGLQNSSITRLTHTWERVPNRWRRLFNDILLPLTDPSKNHRTARLWNNYNENNYITNNNIINMPRLPFLPLILKDLRFAEDANQTDYHKTDNNNDNNNNNNRLINFNKMRLISTSLRSWINCISGYELLHPYNQFIDSNNNKINNSLLANITVQKLLEVTNESKIFVLEHLHCIDDPKIITQLSLRLEPKK